MKKLIFLLASLSFILLTSEQCQQPDEPVSASGVRKAEVQVKTDLNGNTVEQRAIIERIRRDNLPGSIKHLYIISAYSGQVIIYSTVSGKVTSGNKRLTPSTVASSDNQYSGGIPIVIGDKRYYTSDVLGDDGAYGSSGDYIFWFDSKNIYHQHYVTGGQLIHISDQPLAIKNIIINMEIENK